MIKIRALRPGGLKQVLSLLERYSDQESEYSMLRKMQQLYIPLYRLSQLLPLNCQFLPAIFVAISRDKILGLIWLSRDGAHARRWKIDHLILDPEAFSYDVGTQLVNYVINRFGGEGVQTFLAHVDQYYSTGLALLKSCGFRRVTRLHAFSHNRPGNLKLQPATLNSMRESDNMDSERLSVLYNESLPPEVRVCLEKSRRDFARPLGLVVAQRMKGLFFKRWVVEDVAHDHLVAALELTTADYSSVGMSILVHPGWSELYSDVLTFGIQQVLRMSGSLHVHLECFDFNRKGLEVLEHVGFQRNGAAEVLVKDYWIPLDEPGSRLKSPILLFSGRTTPAVNARSGF